ncbi:MAG TPA: PhnD/SsuA/transferrin family substrate-binding protein [Candidatus Sumerlaeota bacterium]|nr:PhnD/SsuA/transferrin family substrate-binding protein [Candidatus Sumerlaeota bacterium]
MKSGSEVAVTRFWRWAVVVFRVSSLALLVCLGGAGTARAQALSPALPTPTPVPSVPVSRPSLALPGLKPTPAAKPVGAATPVPQPAIPPRKTPSVVATPIPAPIMSPPQTTSATQPVSPVTTGTQPGKMATPSVALAESIRAQLAKPTSASAVSAPVKGGRAFRIGFLNVSSGGTQDYEWYQQVQDHLLGDKAFRKAMADAGLTDLHLRPCDGPEDMLQRMGQAEFDLVFCPAMVYVQDRLVRAHVYEPAEGRPGPDRYVVFSKTMMRPSTDQGDGRGRHIVRNGVLFKRKTPALTKKDVKSLLGEPSSVLAVSGSHDAAGYFYVRKMLWEQYEHCSPKFLFFGSPQNVVKAVVSGLCDVGACDESVLQEMLTELGGGEKVDLSKDDNPYVTVINRTQPVPTDPILIRAVYGPGMVGASVGAEMRRALWRLYDVNPGVPRMLRGDEEQERAYKEMMDDVRLMQGYTR